jgi:hypothetical protein
VWKITILRQKILFFPILGGRAPGAPPAGSAPALFIHKKSYKGIKVNRYGRLFNINIKHKFK